ncbi:BTB/POZ and MATH domain-containing protein 1-like [Carex rostrata]
MGTAANDTEASILITKANYGTSHLVKINHTQTKDIGQDEYMTSPTFSSGGYEWEILYFPHLDDDDDPEVAYISFSLTLTSEDAWDVRAAFDLSLLEHDGTPSHHAFRRTSYCFSSQGDSFGYARFIPRSELEDDYVINDCFTLLCTIYIAAGDSSSIAQPESCSLGVPPFDLHDQLERLLKSRERTDVEFVVGGESFPVHRLILAARSPVFNAELFGNMAEASMKVIKINDMKAWVFSALLHFIYTDRLPLPEHDVVPETETGDVSLAQKETVFAQHLLVAADRYGVEGLRVICEERLCKNVNIESVMSTLDLAERLNCVGLKDVCLGFIAVPKNFLRLALSERYVSLMQSCPNLLCELQEKVSRTSAFKGIVSVK